MNILYDHQIFMAQKYGGVSKYFYEIIKNISLTDSPILPFNYTKSIYLKEDKSINHNMKFMDIEFKGSHYIIDKPLNKLNEMQTIKTLKKGNYDIFHPTWYNQYFYEYCSVPFVTTIHDMIQELWEFSHKNVIENKKLSIINATKIIAVSENTKKDILNFYNIDPQKVEVIYHGVSIKPNKYHPNFWGNYILFVGKRSRYKNFKVFVKGIAPLIADAKDLKLICVGNKFKKDELNLFSSLNIENKVLAIQADDLTLHSLYRYAKVFVYPSLYEGFGIPILEAFANGCPCCLSESSCFPEIAQTAASYFDPNDKNSIYKVVKKVIFDKAIRNKLIDSGWMRLAKFSWEKSAIETSTIYKNTIKQK